LLTAGIPVEVVLINRDKRRAEGHLQDLRDAAVFSRNTRVLAGDFGECCSAEVTIITAGVGQAEMKSRLDNLGESAAILRGIVRDVTCYNPGGILLIASNPVDVLTYAVWKWSGLPPGRVIGSGTLLDTSLFRRRLAARFGVSPENVHAYVIGEHGDSQVPVLSSARIAGAPLEGLCRELNLPYDPNALKDVANSTRAAGAEIVAAKGLTYFGVSTALVRIVRAILGDEDAVMTVSNLAPAAMGLGEVFLSLPAIVNRYGVGRVVNIPLDPSEKQALRFSAEILKKYIAMLDSAQTTAA
jgi:L-lactate dehydrogenase